MRSNLKNVGRKITLFLPHIIMCTNSRPPHSICSESTLHSPLCILKCIQFEITNPCMNIPEYHQNVHVPVGNEVCQNMQKTDQYAHCITIYMYNTCTRMVKSQSVRFSSTRSRILIQKLQLGFPFKGVHIYLVCGLATWRCSTNHFA